VDDVICSRKLAILAASAASSATLVVLGLPALGEGRTRVVGISDQHAQTFSQPLFRRLGLRHARLVVSWDALRVGFDRAEVDAWLHEAQANGIRPLVSFSHSRVHPRKRPSVREFRRTFRAFRKRYPWVREYSPWNEANHHSQPTHHRPRLAARYYNVVRSNCRGCTIVALDVLDQPDMVSYVRAFRHWAKGRPRLWGLHNYIQINRRVGIATKQLMRAVPGNIWLTETGGIVKFADTLRYDTHRAARVTRYLFKVGQNRRIKRIYIYSWWGERRGARFDAGLVGPNGRPRPAYYVLKRELGR
jgi:hypothetical protein